MVVVLLNLVLWGFNIVDEAPGKNDGVVLCLRVEDGIATQS